MKQSRLITLCLVALASLLLLVAPGNAEQLISVALSGDEQIRAGDAWSLTVHAKGIEEGETVTATMLHGISIYQTELVFGSGGIALWEFEQGILTQAGISSVIISKDSYSRDFHLEILADEVENLVSFTTTNSLMAYGDSDTSLVTFASDQFGNPVDDATLTVRKTSPAGETRVGFASTQNGLANQTISSLGNPGLLRLLVSHGNDAETSLSIVQLASSPENIEFDLSTNCILSDGLDDLTLTTSVFDRNDFPVTDGQVVIFNWESGVATGITVDGTTSLSIPAPRIPGTYDYSVTVGTQTSQQTLQVTQGQCND